MIRVTVTGKQCRFSSIPLISQGMLLPDMLKTQLTKATSDKLGLLYRNVHAFLKHQKSFRDFSWPYKLDESKGLKSGNTYRNDKSAQLFWEDDSTG